MVKTLKKRNKIRKSIKIPGRTLKEREGERCERRIGGN